MINLFFWVVNILIMISTWIARKDPPTLRVLSAKHSGFLCRGCRIRVDRKVAMGQVVCCVFNLSCSGLLCFQLILQWSAVFSTYPAAAAFSLHTHPSTPHLIVRHLVGYPYFAGPSIIDRCICLTFQMSCNAIFCNQSILIRNLKLYQYVLYIGKTLHLSFYIFLSCLSYVVTDQITWELKSKNVLKCACTQQPNKQPKNNIEGVHALDPW